MNLEKYIHIDKRYQNSINLKLDAGKNEFIEGYIPTQASLGILSRYLRDIYGEGKEKSTLLVGPYGKGKSHLLLVLLRLLQEMDSEETISLIRRCKQIDEKFGDELQTYRNRPIRLLPVIVSFGRESLESSYRKALIRALHMFGMDELVPDSYYSVALDTIENWRENYPDTYHKFYEKLGENRAKDVLIGLKKGDSQSLDTFREIYPQLTSGSVFEPLVETDVPKMYQEISLILQREYGYQGLIIVFDEFSKFMEGETREQVSKDMALVQEMCELAQNSKENQIYHICVAHKSIKEYAGYLARDIINVFTGVDGRILEIFFDASEKNNYELIQNVIEKKEPFNQYFDEINTKLLEQSYHLTTFENDFASAEEFCDIVLRGCYPMTPITTYLLLKVSGKIGQNERSLITFLANKEEHTLASYLEEKGADEWVYPDRIFDYFSAIMKKDIQNQKNHSEWQKTMIALSETEDEWEQKVLKTICMIRVVGLGERIEAKANTLGIALNKSREEMNRILKHMEEKELILYREKLSSYVIRQKIDVDIEERLQAIENNWMHGIDISDELVKLDHRKYELPRRYNHRYEMTRYFDYRYVECDDFLSEDFTFEDMSADGHIFLLIDRQGRRGKHVEMQVSQINHPRLVVLYPKRRFDADEVVKRLLAIEVMAKDTVSVNADKVLLEELAILEEEYRYKLDMMLDELYVPAKGGCKLYYCKSWHTDNFNEGLSKICETYYDDTPRINHELVNRKKISSQIRKARAEVITHILQEQSMEKWQQGTSAEATIYRATLYHTKLDCKPSLPSKQIQRMQMVIREFIRRADGNACPFSELYDTLRGEHMGVREGVIPIYIAWELAKVEGMAVVYQQLTSQSPVWEFPLTAQVLDEVSENPEQYQLYLEEGSVEKTLFLHNLATAFGAEPKTGMSEQLYELVTTMQKWFRELPLCTLNVYMKNKTYGGFCKLLRNPNMNPRQFLFHDIPQVYQQTDLAQLTQRVMETKELLDGYYDELLQQVEQCIRKEWNCGEGSLKPALSSWCEHYLSSISHRVVSAQCEHIFQYIRQMTSHNEENIMNDLAKITVGLYVSDWRMESLEEFEKKLRAIQEEVRETQETDASNTDGMRHLLFTATDGTVVEKYLSDTETDSVYDFMTSSLQSTIEEFGDSLQKEQKIAACLEVLQQLIQN